MVIRRDAAAIVRGRLRQTLGLPASINGGAAVPVVLTRGDNEATVNREFAVERDRQDVLVSAADYRTVPKVGDTIRVTMPGGSTLKLGVYVPSSEKQCYSDSELKTELRVFCKAG